MGVDGKIGKGNKGESEGTEEGEGDAGKSEAVEDGEAPARWQADEPERGEATWKRTDGYFRYKKYFITKL